ncbi:MAG: sigma-70 family RNA polymerase sigma factor [Planctomycetia bacterium]|nr:sigma-70 family RNA polymerase sigma factor [Planctomycetia bacterium]
MKPQPVISSRALLQSAKAGSADAVGHLLETCRTYLVLIAKEELDRALRAKLGGSDLVQETFVIAQHDFARFHGQSPEDLRAWLRGILLNKLQEVRRKYKRGKRQVAREVPLDGMKSAARQVREHSTKANSPSRQAAATEEAERISLALSSLSVDYQRVIQLRNWKRLSFDEIGRQMSRSAGAARALWVRALEQLAKALEPRHG